MVERYIHRGGQPKRFDDISRVSRYNPDTIPNVVETPQGPIYPIPNEVFNALNSAQKILGYANLIGTTPTQPISWGEIQSTSILIVNTSVNDIAVAFGGAQPSVPFNSDRFSNNNVVPAGLAIVFPIHTQYIAFVAAAAGSQVYAYVGLPS